MGMKNSERRKSKRNRVDLNNPASIEIHHAAGAPAKSVYGLDYLYVLGLQAFLTLGHGKFYFLSL